MSVLLAGHQPDSDRFRAGVDVFVQLALDEAHPRCRETERMAMAISIKLPPALRPPATHLAVHCLRAGHAPAKVVKAVDAAIPFILGWKRRGGEPGGERQ